MHLYKYLDSDTVTMQCLHVIAKMIIQLFYVVLFISFYCVSLPTEKTKQNKKKKERKKKKKQQQKNKTKQKQQQQKKKKKKKNK